MAERTRFVQEFPSLSGPYQTEPVPCVVNGELLKMRVTPLSYGIIDISADNDAERVWLSGPAGAFEQGITVLNNSLYHRCLYHQNEPLGYKCDKKRSF